MALALLLLLWLVTLASAYYFAQGWLPVLASYQGRQVDQQFLINLMLLGCVFLLTQFALGWLVWRHREHAKSEVPGKSRGSITLEVFWMSLAAVLFLGLNFFGAKSWASHGFIGPAPGNDPVRVEITGSQFQWYFRYPGADGKFGRTRMELQDASEGNPLGIDPNDEVGNDDFVASALVIPAGREIEVTLRSHDVIHSFFVPALRFKQDSVPGMDVVVHFQATVPGDYEIVCAELCGIGHYKMKAELKVMSEEMFEMWLAKAPQK